MKSWLKTLKTLRPWSSDIVLCGCCRPGQRASLGRGRIESEVAGERDKDKPIRRGGTAVDKKEACRGSGWVLARTVAGEVLSSCT